jgi:hypothetical protein
MERLTSRIWNGGVTDMLRKGKRERLSSRDRLIWCGVVEMCDPKRKIDLVLRGVS